MNWNDWAKTYTLRRKFTHSTQDTQNHWSCQRKDWIHIHTTQYCLNSIQFAWCRPLYLSHTLLQQIVEHTSENVYDEKLARFHYSIIWTCKSWFVLDLFPYNHGTWDWRPEDNVVRIHYSNSISHHTPIQIQWLKSRIKNGLSDN